MIKPEELRIGNLVECTFGFRKINGIARDKEKSVTVTFEDSLPCDSQVCWSIPLNPEWLERCGFERDGPDRWIGPQYETDNTIQWFEIEEDKKAQLYWLRGSEWVMGNGQAVSISSPTPKPLLRPDRRRTHYKRNGMRRRIEHQKFSFKIKVSRKQYKMLRCCLKFKQPRIMKLVKKKWHPTIGEPVQVKLCFKWTSPLLPGAETGKELSFSN